MPRSSAKSGGSLGIRPEEESTGDGGGEGGEDTCLDLVSRPRVQELLLDSLRCSLSISREAYRAFEGDSSPPNFLMFFNLPRCAVERGGGLEGSEGLGLRARGGAAPDRGSSRGRDSARVLDWAAGVEVERRTTHQITDRSQLTLV